jgi:hypothetical protein
MNQPSPIEAMTLRNSRDICGGSAFNEQSLHRHLCGKNGNADLLRIVRKIGLFQALSGITNLGGKNSEKLLEGIGQERRSSSRA